MYCRVCNKILVLNEIHIHLKECDLNLDNLLTIGVINKYEYSLIKERQKDGH